MSVVLLGCGFALRAGAQVENATNPANAAFDGQRIVNVVFDPPEQPLDARELDEILPVKRDQVYTAANIRSAIERLYASGRYQDIQVDASSVTGGVLIRFITKNSWFIGKVAAKEDFAEPPNAGQLVNASRLQLGDPFDMSQIPVAVENIRKLLVQNGYFDPVVDPQFDYDNTYQQVNITFAIQTGKRARYLPPQVSGDTSVLSPDAIAKATHWHRFLLPGYRGITLSRTRSGINNVRLKYENSNRLLATVVLDGIDENKDEHTGTPRITVNPGPTVKITTPGTKISKRQLRQNVPVFEEHTVDADLLTEGASNLRDYFQAQGYFDVEVEYKDREVSNGATEISYVIERGKRHRFVYLGISGNKYFDEKTIRERLFLTPSSFAIRNGRYSEAFVRRDIATITDLYEANGFRDAKVTARNVDNYQGHAGYLAEFFTIEEGPQYLVASLDIKGAKQLDLTKTIGSLSSQPGQVFSEFNVAADRETIIRQYEQNGFPNATFEWNSKPGARPHTFDLQFVIDEGQQQFVRQVVISGLETTRPALVDKQLDLKPGSPLSPTAMSDIQRKLYDLGIFSQVNMAIQNPDGDEDRKYVLYDIDEARRYSITTGFGLQFARIGGSNAVTDLSDPGGAPGVVPRVSMALSRLNLFGRGQTLTVQGVLSTLQKRAALNYFVPKVFNLQKFDATFSLLYDNTFDVRTFQSKREEATVKFTEHVSKPITIFYDFTYRQVGVSDLKIDPLLLPQLAQSVRVGIAEINFIQDRRDDPLDAHKGIYNTVDVGLATKVFGSQTSFARILARNATYHPLGPKLVLARETQVGLQPAFAIPPNSEPGDPIPLAERFFAGGGNTQRGFPENQAGPRDLLTGFPLGGSAMFFNSTELRFPLYGANINGVLFEDAGNVYSSIGAISFRVNQRNQQDFDYMVHAVGFGIRYKTPIGPLRLDLAESLNPPKFNGFPGNYSQLVQCSVANTCQASMQQISHFQFFFSIGQAF
jgi:outer membrane protein assembly complex protein YaeT